MAVKPGPKPRFTKQEFIDGALAVADREGLASLNVRRLAAELGVATGTPYKYFEDMAGVMEGMFARLLEGIEEEIETAGEWRERLTHAMRVIHGRFTDHPAGVELLMRGVAAPQLDRLRETLLGMLEEAGLEAAERAEVLSLLIANVVGLVVMVHLRGGDFRSAELGRRARLPKSDFPLLAHASRSVLDQGAPDPFERGLAAILDSVTRE